MPNPGSIHVFAGEIGCTLNRTTAKQDIRVSDVLPREAISPTVVLEYEEILKPSYSRYKNDFLGIIVIAFRSSISENSKNAQEPWEAQ